MKTYLISYDLIKPETLPEYQRLFLAIKSFEYWAKLLRSVWLIKTSKDKNNIINILMANSDSNDKFIVIEVTNDWIAYNLNPVIINWMRGGL